MDKQLYLSHRATDSIEKAFDGLDEESVFGAFGECEGVDFELAQIYEEMEGGTATEKDNRKMAAVPEDER